MSRRRTLNRPRGKEIQRASKRTPESNLPNPVQQTEVIDSTRRKIIGIGLGISVSAIAGGILFKVCRDTDGVKESKKPDNETINDPKTPENTLFEVPNTMHQIDRSKIAQQLQTILGEKGKVVLAPANYDPSKPNFYILPNRHAVGTKEKFDLGAKIQEEVVRIFHELYRLGGQRQFLEGVPKGLDFKHNIQTSELSEWPLTALPQYKRTGQIRRAYVAIEGIYGDKVESLGTENFKEAHQIKQEIKKYHTGHIVHDLVTAILSKLGIEYDPIQIRQSLSYLKMNVEKIRDHLKEHPEIDIDLLKKLILKENPMFDEFLDATARKDMYMYKERTKIWSEYIKSQNKKDSSFVVGSIHANDLSKLLPDYNVFIIKPPSLQEGALDFHFENSTLSDFRNDAQEYWEWYIGIRNKLKNEFVIPSKM